MGHSLEDKAPDWPGGGSKEQPVVQESNIVSFDVYRERHAPVAPATVRGAHYYQCQTLDLVKAVSAAIIPLSARENSVRFWSKDDAALF